MSTMDPQEVRRIAQEGQVRAVALIHHDPFALDKDIEAHVEECRTCVPDAPMKIPVFAAGDYLEVEVGNPQTYPV